MPEISDLGLQTLDLKKRRPGPASKIAQLPNELRALVNQLLDRGHTYEEVVAEMAKHGISLNTDNISKWFNGPYQDYLAALEWRDELQQLRDHAFSFGQEEGNVRFQEGVVQIGLTHILRDMKEDRFKDDAANSLRLFNSLARLSREALVIRKYADERAKEKAVGLKKLDVNRKMSDAEEIAMQDRADDFFGWKSADRIKRDLTSDCRRRGDESLINKSDSDCSSRGQPSIVLTTKEGDEALINEEPPVPTIQLPFDTQGMTQQAADLVESSHDSQSAETPDNSPADAQHPEEMPESSSCESPAGFGLRQSSGAFPLVQDTAATTRAHEDLCYDCGAPLPRLLPNGQRPAKACIACCARLYPPDTTFDHCHFCGAAQPILSDGARPSPACRRCNQTLSPPGQRFVSHCSACGFELPSLTADGTRISDRCPDCRATVPLLEPGIATAITRTE